MGHESATVTNPLLLQRFDAIVELLDVLWELELKGSFDVRYRTDESLRQRLFDESIDMIGEKLVGKSTVGLDPGPECNDGIPKTQRAECVEVLQACSE